MEVGTARMRSVCFVFALVFVVPLSSFAGTPRQLPDPQSPLGSAPASRAGRSCGTASDSLVARNRGTLNLGDLSCSGFDRMQCASFADDDTFIPERGEL
jgi:hypothetical protein